MCSNPRSLSFSVLVLVLVFAAIAPAAFALPAGLYPLESIRRTSANPLPRYAWEAISGDGSTAVGYLEDTAVSWTLDAGVQPLFPDLEGATRAVDVSANGGRIVGLHIPDSGEAAYTFVQDPDGSRMRIVSSADPITEDQPQPTIRLLSANGVHGAGSRFDFSTVSPGALERVDSWRWSESAGASPLAELSGFYDRGSDTIAVADDGTVFGHAYAPDILIGGSNAPAMRSGAARWAPGQAPELIEGVDGEGGLWRLSWLTDITSDGSQQLGVALRDRLDESGEPVGRFPAWGVFRGYEIDWLIHDRYEDGIQLQPGDLWAISDDGTVVVGSLAFDSPEPVVWRRRRQPESLRTLLELAGIDAEAWTRTSEILDMSADGRTFLARGWLRDETGRERDDQYFLVVIPEPGTALLVGLGLATLGCRRPRLR